jgi:hypothetical protein
MRPDFRFGKFADGLAQVDLLGREVEVHGFKLSAVGSQLSAKDNLADG